jgi:hypothetical protein
LLIILNAGIVHFEDVCDQDAKALAFH